MRRVFVSAYTPQSGGAAELIKALRAAGCGVNHSPWGTSDPRWQDWYDVGLEKSVSGCDAFVAVVDSAWDSSSWMAEECNVAARLLPAAVFSWNPDSVVVAAKGMVPYLRQPLPTQLEEAVAYLC